MKKFLEELNIDVESLQQLDAATKQEILLERDKIIKRFKSVLIQLSKKICKGEFVDNVKLQELFQKAHKEDVFLGFIDKIKYVYTEGTIYKLAVKINYRYISDKYNGVHGNLVGRFGIVNGIDKNNKDQLIGINFSVKEKLKKSN